MQFARKQITKQSFLINNLLSFFGCILLILPGFLSDFLGLLAQLSLFDTIIYKLLSSKGHKNTQDDNIIDVEVEETNYDIHKNTKIE